MDTLYICFYQVLLFEHLQKTQQASLNPKDLPVKETLQSSLKILLMNSYEVALKVVGYLFGKHCPQNNFLDPMVQQELHQATDGIAGLLSDYRVDRGGQQGLKLMLLHVVCPVDWVRQVAPRRAI